MDDDRTLGAGLFADILSGRIRNRDDRDSQFARLRSILESDLVHPAPAKHRLGELAAHRFRRLYADPLDWRYRGGICARTNLRFGIALAKKISGIPGCRHDRGLHRDSQHQRLRRPASLERAEIARLHGAFIFEYHEISAFTPISVDDSRPGDAFSGGRRRLDPGLVAARARIRQGADALLPAPYSSHSLTRADRMLCALSPGLLDVRIAGPRSIPFHSAAGMGILSAHRLSRVGGGRYRPLSALPVVCRFEAVPQRCMAQLFLSCRISRIA